MTAKKKQKPERVESRTEEFTENLPCTLTQAEILERGKTTAECMEKIAKKQKELKSITETYKSEISQYESQAQFSAQEIRTGQTFRDVKCKRTFNYVDGKVIEHRLDTEAMIRERIMSNEETQVQFAMNSGDDPGPDFYKNPVPVDPNREDARATHSDDNEKD